MYIYNIEALAKQGFIVVTVSAAYEAMFTVCPSGEFINQSEAMRQIKAADYTDLHNLIFIRKKIFNTFWITCPRLILWIKM